MSGRTRLPHWVLRRRSSPPQEAQRILRSPSLNRARLFHSTLLPIEAEFIALGASATVAADLQTKINAVQGAWDLKLTGVDIQIGGTRGLKVAVHEGLKHVRKLDAIL